MSARKDLDLELKGLMLARTILDWRGIDKEDLGRYSEEIERVRAPLRVSGDSEGRGARSVAA